MVRLVPEADVNALDGAKGVVSAKMWTFEVPGEPRGKGRPRFGRTKEGRPVAFTDVRTEAYERMVALIARCSLPRGKMLGPLRVSIVAKFSRVSAGGTVGHIDIDNIAKAILDGMAANFNDMQVTELEAKKRRIGEGEEPGVLVSVEQLEA